MKKIYRKKKKFFKEEIWLLTVMGAFQHSVVYKQGITEKQKLEFRNSIFKIINSISKNYKKKVNDDKHIKNIMRLQNYRNSTLINEHLNFGICQKLLNLYLKYLWCWSKKSVAPPHFPVDRTIQQEIKIPYKDRVSWTKINSPNEYMKVINHAKTLLQTPKYKFKSIAELELFVYNRGENTSVISD